MSKTVLRYSFNVEVDGSIERFSVVFFESAAIKQYLGEGISDSLAQIEVYAAIRYKIASGHTIGTVRLVNRTKDVWPDETGCDDDGCRTDREAT